MIWRAARRTKPKAKSKGRDSDFRAMRGDPNARFTGATMQCQFCGSGTIRQEKGPRNLGENGRCNNPACRVLVDWIEYQMFGTRKMEKVFDPSDAEEPEESVEESPSLPVKPKGKSEAAKRVFGS